MFKYGKAPLLVACMVASVAVAAAARFGNQGSQRIKPDRPVQTEVDDEQWPSADYAAAAPTDPEKRKKRRDRGARHNNSDRVREPGDEPGVVYRTVVTNDWEVGLPALPAQQSDAVLVGEVAAAQAFLSNDRSGVYSEFGIRVGAVLKNDPVSPVKSGESITVERPGGRVKFPSNRVLPVVVMGQGMPRRGRKYLLFLKRIGAEDDYLILTGYELRGGRVYPIDGAKPAGGGSPWKFDKYEGWEEATFLKAVHETLTNPR